MNLHPLIPNTRALWQLQGNLKDTSGNGLDLVTLNDSTKDPGGIEQYGSFDSCIQGFKYDPNGVAPGVGTNLIAPLTALLQIVGPWTIQFLLWDSTTLGGNQPFVCLVDQNAFLPGGLAADRIGSIFTFFYSQLTPGKFPYWADLTHGSNLPVPGGNWWTTPEATWGLAPGLIHAVALRFNSDGIIGNPATVDLFLDGVKQPVTLNSLGTPTNRTSTPSVTGSERFYVGGSGNIDYHGSGAESPAANTLIGSVRVLSVARSDADILADANFANAACGGGGGGGGGGTANSGGGNTAAATSSNLVYDAVAAAQFGIALRQAPRS